jgi:hypothetical protein
LLFGNVWWMYGGYAWLTNAVPPREVGLIRDRRLAARVLMALLATMTTFIGLRTTPVAQLAVLVVILIAGNVVEARARLSR